MRAPCARPFRTCFSGYSRKLEWTLIPEYAIYRSKGHRIVVDGAVVDFWKQRRGLWEAKDEHDDLEREIKSKIEKGYPTRNIIFQAPERAILYQHGVRQGLNEDLRDPKNMVDLLTEFFAYREPDLDAWDEAVAQFKDRIPEVAETAKKLIDQERRTNKAFRDSFDAFFDLCRQAINPNLSVVAVEDMLVQHLLTERIFRRVFHAEEFRSRNVIAAEIEKVIASMTSRHFSRDQFLSDLDRFYKAIERAADDKEDYSEKQAFLNTVYERFFQGYSPKEADTHGIVYTPQPIVDFMVRSVEDILQKEFGRSLADKGVHILDPFVGTGNFITRVMRQIAETRKSALPYKYEHELHCNEVMLLPYYIASMNIEHEYLEQVGEYRPFDGICLVDTFELAEPEQSQLGFMTEENTVRVKRQKQAPIFVIIGNPPYNVGQLNENDNNKNRKYKTIDRRVSETYSHNSQSTLLSSLNDPYVKAFRWATDRLGNEGIIAFVSNNSFVDQLAFDGMRKCLHEQFDAIYVLDLGGNVRKNPKLSGTTHNVFGIQVGVSITLLIKKPHDASQSSARLFYSAVPIDWRKERKYEFLDGIPAVRQIEWLNILPDKRANWLMTELRSEYSSFVSIGTTGSSETSIFSTLSHGVNTSRDDIVYAFDNTELKTKIEKFVESYNSEVDRWIRGGRPEKIDDFVDYGKLKWSRNLKRHLTEGDHLTFDDRRMRKSLYRPFAKRFLFFADVAVDELGKMPVIYPTADQESENPTICVTSAGSEKPFLALLATEIANYHLAGAGSGTQCYPFYTYDESGTDRCENITDWALDQFRRHYHDASITKWDIFHYVYAILHHPIYRERYAANLKRELPRIPYGPNSADSLPPARRLPTSTLTTNNNLNIRCRKSGSLVPNSTTAWKRCASAGTRLRYCTTTRSAFRASHPRLSSTDSGTGPPSNG